MKRALPPAVLTGIVFGFIIGAGYSLDETAPPSTPIAAGLVAGVACTIAVAAVVLWRDKRFARWVANATAPYDAEGIVHQGYAAVGSNATAVALTALGVVGALADRGGWLVLTTKRLVFLPHKHNLLGKKMDLALAEIAGARPGDSLLPTTIVVGTRSKQTLQFRVRGRSEWLAKLPGVKPAS